jgi:hypothetical protein
LIEATIALVAKSKSAMRTRVGGNGDEAIVASINLV